MHPFTLLDFGRIRIRVQVAPITEEGLAHQLAEEAKDIRAQIKNRPGLIVEKAIIINHPSVQLVPRDARVRALQADWLKQNEDLIKLTCLGLGFIVENAIGRGLVTAVFWLAPTPVPFTTHPTLDAALAWAIKEVEATGGTPPHPDLLKDGSKAVERALAQVKPLSAAR